jgi:N-acetylated-alpha-linked acidic dipeptidase
LASATRPAENAAESRFLAVPDPKLAEEHLRILTQAPHMAGTPEDKATADYVAKKFREAGLDTEIVEYKVWLNYPAEISVDVTAPNDVTMHVRRASMWKATLIRRPARSHALQWSISIRDVEAEVIYANYGTQKISKSWRR